MNGSVVPWIRRLALPERGPTTFFDANVQADQWVADRERLVHELAVKDEEIAELRCRVDELEASVEFHSEQRRQAIVRAGIERVRSS
jgi:hypothetical protein